MKKVVYTAIIGKYDELKDPTIVTEDWDYLCFTDNPDLHSDIWDIKIVEKEQDLIRLARRIKIAYFDWIEDYTLSIWVDASIQIQCNLTSFVYEHLISENMNRECVLMEHPERDNIREEAQICANTERCPLITAQKQIQAYTDDGYLFDNGLVATGLIMRKHTKRMEEFHSRWIKEIQVYTTRDQLSFNYILSKIPIEYSLLSFDIISTPNKFQIYKHNG